MIGNDIIDLNLAAVQSNWQRKGFLNKLFTKEEQDVLLNSKNPFQFVWLFWSMKESAYKIYVQKYKKRFFTPKKFNCKLISENQGLVFIDGESYVTRSTIAINYIFTQATIEASTELENCHFKVNNKFESQEVYKKLKKTVSKKMNISSTEIQLKKDKIGIPKLYQNNIPLDLSFSLSHHGDYGAYSLLNRFK